MLALPLQPGTTPGDILADFVSGTAFNRVFENGSTVEQGAVTLALVVGVALRWLALHALTATTYAAWREATQRGVVPVRTHPAFVLLGKGFGKVRAATEGTWRPLWDRYQAEGKPVVDRFARISNNPAYLSGSVPFRARVSSDLRV